MDKELGSVELLTNASLCSLLNRSVRTISLFVLRSFSHKKAERRAIQESQCYPQCPGWQKNLGVVKGVPLCDPYPVRQGSHNGLTSVGETTDQEFIGSLDPGVGTEFLWYQMTIPPSYCKTGGKGNNPSCQVGHSQTRELNRRAGVSLVRFSACAPGAGSTAAFLEGNSVLFSSG